MTVLSKQVEASSLVLSLEVLNSFSFSKEWRSIDLMKTLHDKRGEEQRRNLSWEGRRRRTNDLQYITAL